MQRKLQGALVKSSMVGGERYETYIPNALPPVPAIDMAAISDLLEKANLAIGELNGVVENLSANPSHGRRVSAASNTSENKFARSREAASENAPDPNIINYMYVRKEAVLSSQIEGTQSTLDDLLRYESGDAIGTPIDDVAEVSSYVSALNHGLKRIKGGFPLSLRLIREIHKILLANARGKNKMPGEFRTSQNWIGGTRPATARFVPASPDKVVDLMGDLEKFMRNDEDKIPLLVKTALMHQQFETIHPFLDGNGRTGRLLITLYLCDRDFLKSPFLYLSLFFKRHRDLYYEKLDAIRKTGDWEDWIAFFLEGVATTAADAKNTLLKIKKVFEQDDERVAGIGRARESALAVLAQFKQKPLLSIAEITKRTGLVKTTAISAVNRLMDLDIVKNMSEKKWGQIYSYEAYTKLLTPGAED